MRWLLLTFLLAASWTWAQPQPSMPTWPVALQSEVVRLSKTFDGEFAYFVKDVASGTVYSYNGATPFYLASVVKVIVLRELYRQAELGQLKMTDTLEFSPDDLRDGSGDVKRASWGTKFTLDELATRMIGQSDNAATDLLIERLGLEAINRSVEAFKPYGFGPVTTILDVRRKVYSRLSAKAANLTPAQVFELWGTSSLQQRARTLAKMLGESEQKWGAKELEKAFAAYYADLENSASMEAVARMLESLLLCEGLAQSSCEAMMDKLKKCETGQGRLRAAWPSDLMFAHKTGTQHRRICDVGILYLNEERPIVLSACVKDFGKKNAAEDLLANLGRVTLDVLSGRPVRRAPVVRAVVATPQQGPSPSTVDSGR